MIVVVDYDTGNVGSVLNMLKKVGHEAVASGDAQVIARAEKLILPGVGRFDVGMGKLRAAGLEDVLRRRVLEDGTPILGICLGMQLMTRGSEEGAAAGLGWIDAECVRFAADAALRVPHMGWKTIAAVHGETGATHKAADLYREMTRPRFYFVHSYHVRCSDPSIVTGTAEHGGTFCASFARGNIYGVQFHPEKSHSWGMTLLESFARSEVRDDQERPA